MGDHVSIREAARRLGVSDTAVHKAIKSGRVVLVQESPPKLDWEDTKIRWQSGSDASKRSHVGSRGSPRRESDAPQVQLPTSSSGAGPGSGAGGGLGAVDGGQDGASPKGGSYAQSRAVREAYQARLAKLDYEQRIGRMIDADQVKVGWFKQIKAAQTRIMGISAACKSRVPDLPLTAVVLIEQICREALEDLASSKHAVD